LSTSDITDGAAPSARAGLTAAVEQGRLMSDDLGLSRMTNLLSLDDKNKRPVEEARVGEGSVQAQAKNPRRGARARLGCWSSNLKSSDSQVFAAETGVCIDDIVRSYDGVRDVDSFALFLFALPNHKRAQNRRKYEPLLRPPRSRRV
jgi:hypothetical protein